MTVTFQNADDVYRGLRSQYVYELRRLLKTGAMTDREYSDWRDEGRIDAAKFPRIRQLWDRLEAEWPKTRQGQAESKAAAADSPIIAPAVEATAEASPLDESLLATLPSHVGTTAVVEMAAKLGTDIASLLVSFRRVRERLEGYRAYECLNDGQLCIEVLTDDPK